MENIKQYHLHKDDYSKLHFELNDTKAYYERNKSHALKAHRHSFYQLIWFRNAGRHYIDYKVIEHPKNVIFFINKNQIHYFCPDSSNEGYLYHFNDFFLEKFNVDLVKRFSYSIFNEMGNSFVSLSDEDIIKLDTVTSFIKEELEMRDHFYKEQVFYFFQAILSQNERLKKKQDAFDIDANADYHIAFSFKRFIYENMDSFLSLEEYCSKLNTNSKKLTAVCKKYLMGTPAKIIQQLKILEAKRMLANRKTTIQEVAYTTGFDQPTYFTKYFKKATGVTPKEFQSSLP